MQDVLISLGAKDRCEKGAYAQASANNGHVLEIAHSALYRSLLNASNKILTQAKEDLGESCKCGLAQSK